MDDFKPMYNKFLASDRDVAKRTYDAVRGIFDELVAEGYSPRDVSHELIRSVTAHEASVVVARAMKMYKAGERP